MTSNPRNAGKKPSGKVKSSITVSVSPELAYWLHLQNNKAAYVTKLIEKDYHKNNNAN